MTNIEDAGQHEPAGSHDATAVDALLAALTLEEKASLTVGREFELIAAAKGSPAPTSWTAVMYDVSDGA